MEQTITQHSMTSVLKILVLQTCEALGLFQVSARLFRKRLYILCYHGFQIHDECKFRPQLFISASTFERRLQYLKKNDFHVLDLGVALEKLRSDSLPERAVVITIDDGFKSTLLEASPLLRTYALPATVYITTYYVDKQLPVFRLAVQYAFWKAAHKVLDFSKLALLYADAGGNGHDHAEMAMQAIIAHGEALTSEIDRQNLLTRLEWALGVDLGVMREKFLLSLLSAAEIQALHTSGMDIQLHTHRHRFPTTSREIACREIDENRTRLRDITGVTPRHFCYPSGVYDPSQWAWLQEMEVASATTCDSGINARETSSYGLMRFLDSEAIWHIEFKAELMGFSEILRRAKRLFGARRWIPPPHQD